VIRIVYSLAVAVVAAGIVTALSVGFGTTEEAMPPAATAHRDDMTPEPKARALARTAPDAPGITQATARDREPVFLRIDELGVKSPVERTGMDSAGAVAIPEDVTTTAWFTGSRRLAALKGATVIVGHRDSASQGSGALFGIEALTPRSVVTVTGRDGIVRSYRVVTIEFIDKANFAVEAPRIFGHRGPHRLVLITCGGAFDEQARSYLSNVVVTALPAPADSE